MNENRQQQIRDVLVFGLLIAIGVAGRWAQPEWCFTPTAAAAIFAGAYFQRLAIAVMVPLAILGFSDLGLPAHNSVGVLIATYLVMTLPVGLGRMLANSDSRPSAAWRLAVVGLLPATLFYLVSNFAVWAFQSDYPKTLAGLAQCYVAAVPFFRSMLAGDLFYLAVLAACWAAAGGRLAVPQQASAGQKSSRAPSQ